jgi:hypothetical protein
MIQRLISSQKHLDAVVLGNPKQLAAIHAGPTHVGRGNNLVTPQHRPQCVVEIFVE